MVTSDIIYSIMLCIWKTSPDKSFYLISLNYYLFVHVLLHVIGEVMLTLLLGK